MDEHGSDGDARGTSPRDVLAAIPLFAVLAPGELDAVAGVCAERTCAPGEVVCRAGDPGDMLFVVVGGELEVWGGPAGDRVINRLGPGEVLGEMALLGGERRMASVTASRQTRLLTLDRAAFDRHLRANARVLEYLSRLLCQRLATLGRGEVTAKRTSVVAVTGRPGLAGKSLVAATLARVLGRLTGRNALLVRAEPAAGGPSLPSLAELTRMPDDRLTASLHAGGGDLVLRVDRRRLEDGDRGALAALIDRLAARFPFVVLDLGGSDPRTDPLQAVADVIVEVAVARAEGSGPTMRPGARSFRVVNLHNAGAGPLAINHVEPFVLREERRLRGLAPDAQARALVEDRWAPASRVIFRLGRKILGASVGLALGGGAAFGLAHLGVLEVLEKHEVPVDLLAGSSMGSIIAVGYAAGLRAGEMIALAREIGNPWKAIAAAVDLSLTGPAFLPRERLMQLVSPLAGRARDFEDLQLPCRVVATDVESGEPVAIGTGALDLAIRASSTVPMLWAPVRLDGHLLVDGGVSDPVPAGVVRDMGADLCIAVNAVPRLKRGVETGLSRLYRRANVLNPLTYLRGEVPSIFDVVMNCIQTLEHELGAFKAISADVRIAPDLSAYTWTDFRRADEIVACGAEAAERALPEIRRLLDARAASG